MAEEKYKIVFVGLIDDLRGTKEKFRQNISKMFKITGSQIDKLVTKSPVVIKKNCTKEKAAAIAKKLEQIGARVSVRTDNLVRSQAERIFQRKKSTNKFALCINKIESEDAKHRMANYLDSIVDLNYIEIRNELLSNIPTVLPVEFDHEEAQRIRDQLEEFGARASLTEIRKEDSRRHERHLRRRKRDMAIFLGILFILAIAFFFLMKAFKYEDEEFEVVDNTIEEAVVQPREIKIENRIDLPLTKAAIEALQELEGRCRDGISYSEYRDVLKGTRSTVNAYLESEEAENRVQFATSILNILIHYQNAAEIWKYKNTYHTDVVQKKRPDVQIYLRRYPAIMKPLSEGGATEEVGGGKDFLRIDAVVSIVIDQAAKELRMVSKRVGLTPPIL